MTSTPLFSVLIANYNNGRYLEECISSIIKQSYTNWEIIIVDDYSTDALSPQVYQKHSNNDKIKVDYNSKNRGAGFTKRRCAELASGEILGYVDPDDTISENALEIMVEAHKKDEFISLAYSNLNICNQDLKIVGLRKPQKKEDLSSIVFNSEAEAVSHFVTFKKKLYQRTQGISEDLLRAVDKDLYYKLEEVGPFSYIDLELYNYRIHDGGISTNSNMLKAEYWSWVVKTRMAHRRNINLETHYENEIIKKINIGKEQIKRTNNYKLGNFILSPLRSVFRLFK